MAINVFVSENPDGEVDPQIAEILEGMTHVLSELSVRMESVEASLADLRADFDFQDEAQDEVEH